MLDAAFGCRPCGFRYILKQRAVLVIRHPFRSLQKCAAKDSSSFCVELESSIFGESAFMVSEVSELSKVPKAPYLELLKSFKVHEKLA